MGICFFLVFFLFLMLILSALYCSPTIETNDGNLKIASPGDVVFQAGEGSQIQFMSSDGEEMLVGQKGDKVRKLSHDHSTETTC